MPPDKTNPHFNRRNFLVQAAASAATLAMAHPAFGANSPAVPGKKQTAKTPPEARPSRPAQAFPICGLEKHFFEKYTPEQTAQAYADIGIDIELTLRPEGHIKPENAASELPAMAAAFAKHQRRILMLGTSFIRPDELHIESTLRAAKQLGIPYWRHRGFQYRLGTPIKDQIASFRSQVREFAAISKAIGIQALYQNHAGANYVGAAIWDLDQVLDDVNPKYFGVALDVRHLLVEQGRAWPTAIRLIAPRVGSLFVKSFRWDRDTTVEVPLREGIVTAAMVNAVVGDRPSLPICVHVEHTKLQPVPYADRAGIVGLFRNDVAVLRDWLGLVPRAAL